MNNQGDWIRHKVICRCKNQDGECHNYELGVFRLRSHGQHTTRIEFIHDKSDRSAKIFWDALKIEMPGGEITTKVKQQDMPPEETFMQKSAFLYPGNIDQAKDTIERHINESNKAQTTPTDYLSFKHIPLKPHLSSLLQATDSFVIYSGEDPNPICVLSLCPSKVATSIYCDETGPKGLTFWNDLCRYMQPRWEFRAKLGEKFIPRFIHYPPGLTQEFPGYTVSYGPLPTVEDDPQQSTSLTSTEVVPWEKIPDYRWDRAALELWWQGYECKEIADKIEEEVADKTVRNRLSQLRRSYGEDIVPTDRQRRKIGIKVRTSGY
jgi:hypothetical protein